MKLAITALSLIFASTSFADQCSYNSTEVADKALELISMSLKNSPNVLEMCELCGETEATALTPEVIEVTATGDLEAPAAITIDGETHDLAYLYVNTNGNVWENLGMLAGCGPFGVSAKILQTTNPDGSVKYTPNSSN